MIFFWRMLFQIYENFRLFFFIEHFFSKIANKKCMNFLMKDEIDKTDSFRRTEKF